MDIRHSNAILTAVTLFKSLDVVCDYALRLARRTGKKPLLFILLVRENQSEILAREQERKKLRHIQKLGKAAEVEIRYEIVDGKFPLKVAEFLIELDCPLLVVGEGDNRDARLRQLREIESILLAEKSWHHRNSHHFLMVSERRQDSVFVFVNRDDSGKKV